MSIRHTRNQTTLSQKRWVTRQTKETSLADGTTDVENYIGMIKNDTTPGEIKFVPGAEYMVGVQRAVYS